ncbi:peptidase domain-containing ABC transporter [Persicitalea jodogahamensis]|uniref:ABC transporter ATP-binding protein n=1 Tax=Persicitalea jodogahamensis TaxID=402147 RepID=A0A8J3G9B4_9BACT|nr:ATP-binding cassette domain-containing protein [Persicitalea jodogahamensis]GHB64931.1 ABC transporter ATP-binding protein [Persicitalea jodogahamensis]
MNSRLIQAICQQLALVFESKNIPQREVYDSLHLTQYAQKDLPIFLGDLISKAREYDLTLVSSHAPAQQLATLVQEAQYPILYFEKTEDAVVPVLGGKKLDGTPLSIRFSPDGRAEDSASLPRNPYLWTGTSDTVKNGQALYLTAFPMESLVSNNEAPSAAPLTPVQRFFRLLGNEKKDIGYIYLYAIVIGLITLSLPLGIQAIINLISGGMVFSSVYLLLFVVIGGVLISGIMQIIQFTLVETLQQRIFAKAAFEFTYRIPRVKAESLLGYYPPELMNRFFDILTVQKSLPKILIDITGAILQILLGIMLLSFYHPFFIAFGFLTILIVALIIYFNGPKGLQTSLVESKYKYKVAQWLEDIARSLYTFKLSGTGNLPMEKMDGLVNNYLIYRKKHFKILKVFFWNAVGFKTLVIGGLLILGTFLVVDRQISLGQFVATEIIIVLLTSSVEKLIQSIDTIFDALTAVEKLGYVTDMPLEREQGFRFSPQDFRKGLFLEVKDLKYRFEGRENPALDGISFSLKPGESVCVTGTNGSGKNTLLRVLSGLLTDYQGGITFNGISLRDLNVVSLRSYIEQNIAVDDIFEGSILENITMGRDQVSLADLEWALHMLNLTDAISKLPDGLKSNMLPGGRRYSESFIAKITLARCIVTRPKILMVNDVMHSSVNSERQRLIRELTKEGVPWSLLILSNDPMIMSQCDRVLLLHDGKVVSDGRFEEVKHHPALRGEFQAA